MAGGAQKTSQFNQATTVTQADQVPLLQGGELKRVTVAKLTGNVDLGWVASGESWTFVSFSSTTRIGIVTVPSDATIKYTPGNRVRIQQATGDVKYGIIHAVSSTQLTIFFPTGTTLVNEAITSPVYSALDSPVGFSKDPDLWTLVTRKTTRTTQSASVNTYYNIGGNLPIGAGKWLLSAADLGLLTHNPAGYMGFTTVLSTASSGISGNIPDTRMRSSIVQATTSEVDDQYQVDLVPFFTATPVTIYMNRCTNSGSGLTLYSEQTGDQYANGTNFIKALSATLS